MASNISGVGAFLSIAVNSFRSCRCVGPLGSYAVTKTGYSASMTNPALLWNAPRPSDRQPRAGERVWSMMKNGKRVDAELRDHGEVGCEVQFLFNGELAHGRLWQTRAGAMAEAESKRRELETKGWTLIDA